MVLDLGVAETQTSFCGRPCSARLAERTQTVDVSECGLVEPQIGAKLDPPMIRVVGDQHTLKAQLRPHRLVLPQHVVRRMKIVVKENVNARKLVQQPRKAGANILKDQSVAISENALYFIGNGPPDPLPVPRVQRTVGECSPASRFRRKLKGE